MWGVNENLRRYRADRLSLKLWTLEQGAIAWTPIGRGGKGELLLGTGALSSSPLGPTHLAT